MHQRVTAPAAVVAAVILLLAVLPFGISRAAAAAGPATAPVTVTLVSMSPRTPEATALTQRVTFTATVTNTGDTAYSDFAVGLERGAPLVTEAAVQQAIAKPPDTGYLVNSNDVDQRRGLPAHATVTIRYDTTPDSDHMCLCATAVYPYALVVRAQTDPSSEFDEIGRTQVLVPSFQSPPQPVRVSWIWPLIDRPHRGLGETVFDDDELAASVGGGRLDRALEVAEQTASTVRMTLVVDPELLDSLAIMGRSEGYTVRQGSGTVAGNGGRAARSWLERLKALVGHEDISLTGYADPDVNALARAGRTISDALDPQVQHRVTAAVASLPSFLSWPAGSALTGKALDAVVSAGASTVLLNDAALPAGNSSDAVAPLPTASGRALALVTDKGLQRSVQSALTFGAQPAHAVQDLIGQLAVRSVADPTRAHYAVLAPDRYVDPVPATAVALIQASTGAGWLPALSVPAALASVPPVDRGSLRTSAESAAAEVTPTQLAAVGAVDDEVASLREALQSGAAAQLLGDYSLAIQRATSSAWRADRARGATLAADLQASIQRQFGAVSLVRPAEGTYGLSSSNSPVVLTIRNDLTQDVTIRVGLTGAAGVIGFHATTLTEVIPAGGRRTIQVPTHSVRLGRFKAIASITTPDGRPLGTPIVLNLRSTALGGITKTITIAAGSLLVLALLRRLVRRVRHRPRGDRPEERPAGAGVVGAR